MPKIIMTFLFLIFHSICISCTLPTINGEELPKSSIPILYNAIKKQFTSLSTLTKLEDVRIYSSLLFEGYNFEFTTKNDESTGYYSESLCRLIPLFECWYCKSLKKIKGIVVKKPVDFIPIGETADPNKAKLALEHVRKIAQKDLKELYAYAIKYHVHWDWYNKRNKKSLSDVLTKNEYKKILSWRGLGKIDYIDKNADDQYGILWFTDGCTMHTIVVEFTGRGKPQIVDNRVDYF